MKIQIRYFAIFRERIGQEEESLELAQGTTVRDAIDQLASRHPIVSTLLGTFRAAVNQRMVDDEHRLEDGDELALIPPVAGGSGRYAVVLDKPLSLDRVVSAVRSPELGGLVTFTGTVRRQSQGREVSTLHYEAYSEMAESVFSALCQQIEGEWPGTRLAIEHRVGTLSVGDDAVVIAAAAPHRAEAFSAARALIDRLKESAPIWKKETGPDGTSWVGIGP